MLKLERWPDGPIGVSEVKNSMHGNKEDSIVHVGAEALWTAANGNK